MFGEDKPVDDREWQFTDLLKDDKSTEDFIKDPVSGLLAILRNYARG